MNQQRRTRAGLLLGLLVTGTVACLAWQVTAAEPANTDRIPDVVKQAIHKAFPSAKIGKAETSPRLMVIHEVDLVIEGRRCTVEVLANGEILQVERDIPADRLPKAVSEAIRKQAANAAITEIEEKQVHARVSVARLREPQTVYEIEYLAHGREVEVQFSQDGKLLSRKIEDDDDDGTETDVSLKEVPAAVRKTILEHAGDNRVTEVEKQTRNGKTTYEAEWRQGGKEVEITVDADGNLLGREVGDDDEDDDDDDDDDNDD